MVDRKRQEKEGTENETEKTRREGRENDGKSFWYRTYTWLPLLLSCFLLLTSHKGMEAEEEKQKMKKRREKLKGRKRWREKPKKRGEEFYSLIFEQWAQISCYKQTFFCKQESIDSKREMFFPIIVSWNQSRSYSNRHSNPLQNTAGWIFWGDFSIPIFVTLQFKFFCSDDFIFPSFSCL